MTSFGSLHVRVQDIRFTDVNVKSAPLDEASSWLDNPDPLLPPEGPSINYKVGSTEMIFNINIVFYLITKSNSAH